MGRHDFNTPAVRLPCPGRMKTPTEMANDLLDEWAYTSEARDETAMLRKGMTTKLLPLFREVLDYMPETDDSLHIRQVVELALREYIASHEVTPAEVKAQYEKRRLEVLADMYEFEGLR